nr:hypothetical protein [Acinetobacter oleivorans]
MAEIIDAEVAQKPTTTRAKSRNKTAETEAVSPAVEAAVETEAAAPAAEAAIETETAAPAAEAAIETEAAAPAVEAAIETETVAPAVEEVVKTETTAPLQKDVLGPLDLAVTNFGANTHCNVSRKELSQNKRVVITYKTIGAKTLAQKNFAQLNALSGKNRFKVEG